MYFCVVDIVVLVGDLVDGRVDQLKFAAEPLKQLSPPKGKFFVTGKGPLIPNDCRGEYDID